MRELRWASAAAIFPAGPLSSQLSYGEADIPSAIILGGGLAGSAAGLALVQAGWQVRIYERAAWIEAVGGALSI